VLSQLRPDGQLHVETLTVGRGQAVLIRGPTGRTALVVRGRADAASLATEVSNHLMVWEHKLDSVVALDQAASNALRLTLERYSADRLVQVDATETSLELGGGAALYVSSSEGRLVVSRVEATSGPT